MSSITRDLDAAGSAITPLFRKDQFMQDPIIVDLLSYWESLRAGRIAPMRSELDPREISAALEHTFVLEYNHPQDVRFRLAGQKICEVMGMEMRGMPARALIELGHREEFAGIIDDLVASPKIVELDLNSSSPKGTISARMLLLPMQDQNGNIARILGCLTRKGRLVQSPQRFAIARVKTTRIVGAMAPNGGQAAGFAEQAALFDTSPNPKPHLTSKTGAGSRVRRPKSEKPYLRLVKDE